MRSPQFAGIWLVWVGSFSLFGAPTNPPVRLATELRLEVVASPAVARLRDGVVVKGVAEVHRSARISGGQREANYVVVSPLLRFATNDFAFRFVPESNGLLQVFLRGPMEESSKDVRWRQEIWWDSMELTGATTVSNSWTRLAKPIRAWCDEPAEFELNALAGVPVTLRFRARPMIPPGAADMSAVADPNSPARRAARILRRGMTLNSFLETPPNQAAASRYATVDFRRMREEGFDHVRVPVAWHFYAGPAPDFAIAGRVFEEVDALVNSATTEGLNVILALAAFDPIGPGNENHFDEFLAMWGQVAGHYAKAPAGVSFELLVRNGLKVSTPVMNQLNASAVRVIRASNPDRTLFVSPGGRQDAGQLPLLRLPDGDANLIVALRSWEPDFFARQGAQLTPLKGVRYPGPPAEPLFPPRGLAVTEELSQWLRQYNSVPPEWNPSGRASFQGALSLAARWSEHYGRPIHVTEFGCTVIADAASRAQYVREFREAAEAAGCGWSFLGWRSLYRYWETPGEHAVVGLRDALFGERKVARLPDGLAPSVKAELDQLRRMVSTSATQSQVELAALHAATAGAREENKVLRQILLGVGGLVLAVLVSLAILWRRYQRQRFNQRLTNLVGPLAPLGVTGPPLDPAGALESEALASELAAGDVPPSRSRQLIHKLLYSILWQRQHFAAAQRLAAKEIAEMEQRLEQIHAPLKDRLQAYEARIADLEKELARKGKENSDLIKAKILLTKQQIEVIRARAGAEWKN